MDQFDQQKRPMAPRDEDFVYPAKTNRTGRITGWVQSLTTVSSHPVHSGIERSWLRLLDVLPGVRTFATQQKSFNYKVGNEIRRYTPDTRVTLNNGSTVYVEVKAKEEAASADFIRFWRMMEPAFRERQLRLHVVTDAFVKHKVIDWNVRRLHRHRPLIPTESMAFQLIEKVERDGPATIKELSSHFENRVLARQTIESLILRKRLTINFFVPLDIAVVSIPDHLADPFQESHS